MSESEPYILLIDDDEDNTEVLSSSLQSLRVKAKSFNAGSKAVFFLQLVSDVSAFPSLVISDYNMPEMNGRELLLFLKNNKVMKNIPVVIFSTSLTPSLIGTLTEIGAINCFTKPWAQNELAKQAELFKDLLFSLAP